MVAQPCNVKSFPKLLLTFLPAVAFLCGAAPAQTYDEFLDNGVIRIGIETDEYGGAITYLSLSGQNRNLINNYDRGRQIQQSYYAGQNIDRRAEGQHPAWSPWMWNPIQVGDAYGNSSTVVQVVNDGTEIYVKTIPLLWDMSNEAAECTIETWVSLNLNTAHIHNKLTVNRTDDLWSVQTRHQETPAVYTIGDLGTLKSYAGGAPFTRQAAQTIVNTGPPWAYWGEGVPTEKWAALVDSADWGIGVYNAETQVFVGGYTGTVGGGEFSPSAGYMSPLVAASLGKTSVFEYEYDLVIGHVESIRAFAYNAQGIDDYDQDGLTYDEETRDLDPGTPGLQNPFDPGRVDGTGNNRSSSPDGTPDTLNDWDADGINNLDETRDLDPITPGIQNPFNPVLTDSTGDNGNPTPDGIPDGLNDWDGDGMSNGNEFRWNYDPLDPASCGSLPTLSRMGHWLLLLLVIGLAPLSLYKTKHRPAAQ